LVLVFGPVFFFQEFAEAKGSGICTTAHFSINHLFETID
jgi:predicted outer membrane repeat protein